MATEYDPQGRYLEFSNVAIITETAKAVRCDFGDGEVHWVPKSQVHDDSPAYQDGDTGDVVIAKWFCDEQGIPY